MPNVKPVTTGERRAFPPKHAAFYLGMGQSTLSLKAVSGQILAHKDGKSTVYFREDLDAYLDALPLRAVKS